MEYMINIVQQSLGNRNYDAYLAVSISDLFAKKVYLYRKSGVYEQTNIVRNLMINKVCTLKDLNIRICGVYTASGTHPVHQNGWDSDCMGLQETLYRGFFV